MVSPKTAGNILVRMHAKEKILEEQQVAIDNGTTLKTTPVRMHDSKMSMRILNSKEHADPDKETVEKALSLFEEAVDAEMDASRNQLIFLTLIVFCSIILAFLAYLWSDLTGTLTTGLGGSLGSFATFATVKDSIFSYFNLQKDLRLRVIKIRLEYEQGNYPKALEMIETEIGKLEKTVSA